MAKKPEKQDQDSKKTSKPAADKAVAKPKAKPGVEASAAKATDKKEKKAKKPGAAPGGKRAPLAPKTFFAPWGTYNSKWKIIDANGLTLGRISAHIAHLLMGKHMPQYTRHAATGDSIIVVNASKVVVTGKKRSDKLYQWHTGYPGGVKTFTLQEMLDRHPERLVERAVYGMLPKGPVGRQWVRRLHVYAGSDHPHKAQQPETVTLPNLGGGSQKTA